MGGVQKPSDGDKVRRLLVGYLSTGDQLAGGQRAVRGRRYDVVLQLLFVLALRRDVLRLEHERRGRVGHGLGQREQDVLSDRRHITRARARQTYLPHTLPTIIMVSRYFLIDVQMQK